MKKETKEFLRRVLSEGNKVFLDKICKQEELRHCFYQVTDENGIYFYHIRFSYVENQFTPRLKDYDVVDVETKEKDTYIEKLLIDIQNNYMRNGYLVSCDKKG